MQRFTVIILAALTFLSTVSYAQSYGTALGLRLGNNNSYRTVGLSYKHRIVKYVTLEGLVQTDFNHNTTVHALIQRHRGILTKRFNFYVGTGISLGSEESILKETENKQVITTYGNFTAGVDLVMGIEFTLLKHNFSLDYKPNFNIVGREPWYRGQVGLTARSVLLTGAKQNKRKRKRARLKRKKERTKAKENKTKEKGDSKTEKPLFGDFFKKITKKKTKDD